MIRRSPRSKLVLSGCSNVCPVLGDFVGLFAGDAEGDLVISVAESDEKEMADLEVRLTTPGLEAFGSAVITCDGGAFSVSLETADISDFGSFSGDLDEGDASAGEWSFSTGEVGTWSAALSE